MTECSTADAEMTTFLTIRNACAAAGVSRAAVYKRLQQGMALDDAIAAVAKVRRGEYKSDRAMTVKAMAERNRQSEINRLLHMWQRSRCAG